MTVETRWSGLTVTDWLDKPARETTPADSPAVITGDSTLIRVSPSATRAPQQDPQLWNATRYMWSTVTLYHAAARNLYKRGNQWVALAQPAKGDESARVFDFTSTGVTIDRDLRTKLKLPQTRVSPPDIPGAR